MLDLKLPSLGPAMLFRHWSRTQWSKSPSKLTAVQLAILEDCCPARSVLATILKKEKKDTRELYLPVSVLGLEGTQGPLFATWQDMFRRGAVNLFHFGTFLLPFSTV